MYAKIVEFYFLVLFCHTQYNWRHQMTSSIGLCSYEMTVSD